nr:DUF222 domain-containing protein [Agrococcus sp. REN33]
MDGFGLDGEEYIAAIRAGAVDPYGQSADELQASLDDFDVELRRRILAMTDEEVAAGAQVPLLPSEPESPLQERLRQDTEFVARLRAIETQSARMEGERRALLAAHMQRVIAMAGDAGPKVKELAMMAAVELGLTAGGMVQRITEAWTIVTELPAAHDAATAGRITTAHLRIIEAETRPLRLDTEVVPAEQARVVDELVAVAESTSTSRLRSRAKRIVNDVLTVPLQVRHDAARERRQVSLFPGGDGMGDLVVHGPILELTACMDRLTQAARRKPKDDPRTFDQFRTDALLELMLAGVVPEDLHGISPIKAHVAITIPATELLHDEEQARGVAGPADLHEHRLRLQRLAGGGEGRGRHAPSVVGEGGGQHPHAVRAEPLVLEVADLDQPLGVGRAGVAGDHERAARLRLPHQRRVARVHPGREGLGEQRLPVVPDRQQPEAARGRVDGGSRPDDRDRIAIDASQEPAIAIGPLLPRVELDHALGTDGRAEGEPQLPLLAVVGHDDDRLLAARDGLPRERRERDRPPADPRLVLPCGRVGVGHRGHPARALERDAAPGLDEPRQRGGCVAVVEQVRPIHASSFPAGASASGTAATPPAHSSATRRRASTSPGSGADASPSSSRSGSGGSGGGSGAPSARAASQAFSTRAWRPGIATRSTSAALPAARSATARASAHTSGCSTGTDEMTCPTSATSPSQARASVTSTTKPVAIRSPRRGTRTRTPGATPVSDGGTRYSKSRSSCGSRESTTTRAKPPAAASAATSVRAPRRRAGRRRGRAAPR